MTGILSRLYTLGQIVIIRDGMERVMRLQDILDFLVELAEISDLASLCHRRDNLRLVGGT